ncbi:MAG: capsular polysaccharide biosynthesis protein [Sphingobium sp.]
MTGGHVKQWDERDSGGVTYIAGWGAKTSGRRAERLAHRHGLKPLYLEDGFLRSFGMGDHFPPLSLVADDIGIYYDCTRPSAIENLLNSETDLLYGIREDVARARQLILDHQLSKYNHARPFDPDCLRPDDRKRILIVDQTVGDLSITLGGAGAETFQQMYQAARAEHPGATLYVKTHPEVVSGRKGGHYGDLEDDEQTVLLRDAVTPLSLIAHMDHVYVISSTMGFEALLAGKPVTCFGMPWYAGWGATDDRLSCPRRTRKRSVEELFAGGYFHYVRYLDPITHERGTIFDVIGWLLRQREAADRLYGPDRLGRLICVGFRRWKRINLTPILSLLPNHLHFVANAEEARALKLQGDDKLIWWGAKAPAGIAELGVETGTATLRMEDGFIRSVGLGSDLIAPLSIVLDPHGIYFDPRSPSGLERELAPSHFDAAELSVARNIRRQILERGITKYNMEARHPAQWPSAGQSVLLVPGQVEDDASILFGCTDIRTNSALLAAVRTGNPDAFIVYKPHPDVLSGNRRGALALKEARRWADHIETDLSVISCIEACDEVHTMTSLTGFDALLRDKKVVTYGQPFYAGWGLTEDLGISETVHRRRTARLIVEELVAGTLLRYPFYWDPDLKGFTNCDAVIRRIVEQRDALEKGNQLETLNTGFIRRQFRKAHILIKAFLPRLR